MLFVNSVALHRLLQTIAWQGSTYDFFRPEVNEYGEKDESQLSKIAKFKGLFHNGSSNHIKVTTSDAGSVIDKNTPYIMSNWTNASELQLEDRVDINGRTFKVTGINNIAELNIVGEISLEVVL